MLLLVHSLRCPLANCIQRLPLTPHILRIRLVDLVRMTESTVAIPSLVGVIIQQARGLRLEREVSMLSPPICEPSLAHQTEVQRSALQNNMMLAQSELANTTHNSPLVTRGDCHPGMKHKYPFIWRRKSLPTGCDRHEGLSSPTIKGEVGPFPLGGRRG